MNTETDHHHHPSALPIPEPIADGFASHSNNVASCPMSEHNIALLRPGADHLPALAVHFIGGNANSCAGAALQIPIAW
jgi:hypothetical protein